MSPKSKFDEFIAEMDSTMWPVPGQDMNNRSVVYKALPSVQAVLGQQPDTDAAGLIDSAPSFATPLQHVMEKGADVHQALQTVKVLFIEAKASPVYQGRDKQQKKLDQLIGTMEKLQEYFYDRVIKEMDELSLANLGNASKLGE